MLNFLRHANGEAVLDRLYDARRRMENKPYVYTQWRNCTAGHIYKAALRVPLPSMLVATRPRASQKARYQELLEVIIDANPDIAADVLDGRLSERVSTMTANYSNRYGVSNRKAGVALVTNAINKMRTEQELALNVLAEAQIEDRSHELEPVA